MKVFGLSGWSGSGKTTLMAKLLPELISRGLKVSTMKHAHHDFDVDTPGKDSYVHRESGATEVMIGSATRWALLHEVRDEPEPDFDSLLAVMTPVDLLLIEGFKRHGHSKLEIYRKGSDNLFLHNNDPEIVAIASDGNLDDGDPNDADSDRVPLPVLDLNDPVAIADFILDHTGLSKKASHNGAT
jgi:molybdopterin-guanine dinucleotide biosynthesis protein B